LATTRTRGWERKEREGVRLMIGDRKRWEGKGRGEGYGRDEGICWTEGTDDGVGSQLSIKGCLVRLSELSCSLLLSLMCTCTKLCACSQNLLVFVFLAGKVQALIAGSDIRIVVQIEMPLYGWF